jgi:hypothetical protein
MQKQHSLISLDTPSEEESHTMSKPIFEPPTYDVTSDDYSVLDADSQVSENNCTTWKNQAFHTTEGVTPVEFITAGTSQRGQVCTMS